MKYFKPELCGDLSAEADLIWRENSIKYWNGFALYQHRLPIRFMETYRKHAFHDYQLEAIRFHREPSKLKYHIELVLSYDDWHYTMQYLGVNSFTIEGNLVDAREYLYGEILSVDDKFLSHEILFCSCTTYIEFRSLKFWRTRLLAGQRV